MPRCLVIGTSNSIKRHGFRPLLATLRPDVEVALAAVGGSPSILLPYMLGRTSLAGVGHVVIDTLVNDSGHTANGWADPDLCEMALLEGTQAIRDAGVPVTWLLMPQLNVQQQAQALRRRRLAIAAAAGIGVIDGYAIVEELIDRFGLNKAFLFEDAAHAAWPVTLLIARRLAARLGDFPAQAQGEPSLPYVVRVPAAEGVEVVERSTSLASLRYLALGEGQVAQVALDEPADLLGIALNTARASGFLKIESDAGQLVKNLVVETDGPGGRERDLVHAIAATMAPLRGRHFVLSVHSKRPEGAVEHSKRASDDAVAATGAVEIEALILRKSSAPSWSPPGVAPAAPAPAALGPEEAAIAMTAAYAAAKPVPGKQFFRNLVAKQPPVWELKPHQIARILVELGTRMGDLGATARLRRQAADSFPNNPGFAASSERAAGPRKEPSRD